MEKQKRQYGYKYTLLKAAKYIEENDMSERESMSFMLGIKFSFNRHLEIPREKLLFKGQKYLSLVSDFTEVPIHKIIGTSRKKEVVMARTVWLWCMMDENDMSEDILCELTGFDRTNIFYWRNKKKEAESISGSNKEILDTYLEFKNKNIEKIAV